MCKIPSPWLVSSCQDLSFLVVAIYTNSRWWFQTFSLSPRFGEVSNGWFNDHQNLFEFVEKFPRHFGGENHLKSSKSAQDTTSSAEEVHKRNGGMEIFCTALISLHWRKIPWWIGVLIEDGVLDLWAVLEGMGRFCSLGLCWLPWSFQRDSVQATKPVWQKKTWIYNLHPLLKWDKDLVYPYSLHGSETWIPGIVGLSWAVLRHISSNKHVLVYGAHPVCCGNENIHLQKLDLKNIMWFRGGGSFKNLSNISYHYHPYPAPTIALDYQQKTSWGSNNGVLGSLFTSS